MFKLEKHIFICENQRPAGAPKKSCGNHGGSAFRVALKSKIAKRGLNHKIRINRAGCLGKCGFGPTVVIYPQGIWYGGIENSDLDEIFDRSILKDEIIERLIIKDENEKTTSA